MPGLSLKSLHLNMVLGEPAGAQSLRPSVTARPSQSQKTG